MKRDYRSLPRRIFAETHRLGSALSLALALGACTATEPTQIVAGVSTQIRVPDELQAVGITVQAGGQVVFCNSYPVTQGFATLPATLGLRGDRNGLGDKGPITFQVLGFKDADTAFGDDCLRSRDAGLDDTIVMRRRRLLFSEDRILYLPMQLKESCRDKLQCDDDQTCVGGKCVSADIDSSTLPEYSDSLVFGTTNTCFDGNDCMPKGASIPVVLEDAKTCTFRVEWPENFPQPEKGALNVRLFYESFGTEILDLDTDPNEAQHEGFSFVDPESPLRFRLAPNLCETNYNSEDDPEERARVLAVDANTFCPAKRAYQPLCTSYVAPDPRVTSANGGTGEPGVANSESNGRCTVAALRSVESAVYVLMDQSASMDKFFGEKGLQFAIGLPLSSPVAKRTRGGFGLLPPDGDLCGTTDYAPVIPLGSVDSVQAPIAYLLQDASLLENDPPSFFLEAALRSAYGKLESEKTANSARFNRRAVIVISNRDISSGRCPGESAVELAHSARTRAADPIYTYAVALDDGEDGALESAADLAEAGGTLVFDGVNDEAEGAGAVQQILTELGTCLYEVRPTHPTAEGEPLTRNDRVSYINPLSPSSDAVEIGPMLNAGAFSDTGASATSIPSAGSSGTSDGLTRCATGALTVGIAPRRFCKNASFCQSLYATGSTTAQRAMTTSGAVMSASPPPFGSRTAPMTPKASVPPTSAPRGTLM